MFAPSVLVSAGLAALCAAVLAGSGSAQLGNPWAIGEPLPDLRLPTIDGDTLALSDLRGKKVILIEFASW
ncbi:MAG: hypothetical protein AAF682_07035 [Planctomycetota bacterium]